MRFDKKTRKLKPKRKKRKAPFVSLSFLAYLGFGLVILFVFYYLLLGGHQKQLDRVRQEKIREDMDRICMAAVLFYQDHGRYPADEEGIKVLVKGMPVDAQGPASSLPGYLSELPLDPWGAPYVYMQPKAGGKITLLSCGSDHKPGGEGEAADIVREGC